MNNIWILTEEKPKISTIKSLINIYKDDFGVDYVCNNAKIKPIINNNFFSFTYIVENITVNNINKIYIKTVSGNSSFLDFIFIVQENEPLENERNNIIFGVEETKTSGSESRNTNAYQRGTKFIYFKHFYPSIPSYMLYNDELEENEENDPTDTEIFGTRLLMTLGVKYIGKKMCDEYIPFNSLDELIDSKNAMSPPPANNVPVRITKDLPNNTIYISGTLSKPIEKGNIGHDPNIGCLSSISAAIRSLGWTGNIVITRSSVKQDYIDSARVVNKFLYVCELLNIKIQGITLNHYELPNKYWHYETNSEKMASILFHVLCEYIGLKEVYHNHAGSERGYFKSINNTLITLPKYCGNDINGNVIALKNKNDFATNKRDLLIPDVIIRDDLNHIVYLIEGKQLSTLDKGLLEIEDYDDIESLYINKYYPGYIVKRYLTIFGGNLNDLPNDKILLYLNDSGKIIMNTNKEPELSSKILTIQ